MTLNQLTARVTDKAPTVDLPLCITQDAKEPASPDFLAICTTHATEIACSRNCPDECGGHPICRPCLALASTKGMIK